MPVTSTRRRRCHSKRQAIPRPPAPTLELAWTPPSAARQLDPDVGRLHRSDRYHPRPEPALVGRLARDQRHDPMRTRLHLDLGRDTVLDHARDDPDKALAGRLACRRRRILARQGSHVPGEAGSVDLTLPAGPARSLDMARVDQPPHGVRADPQQLGSLPDPEMSCHTRTIANAPSWDE